MLSHFLFSIFYILCCSFRIGLSFAGTFRPNSFIMITLLAATILSAVCVLPIVGIKSAANKPVAIDEIN